MIKTVVHTGIGRHTLVLGLSFRNLEKFKEAPGDTFIRIDGRELHLPIDVVIFSGETEDQLAELVRKMFGEPREIIDKRPNTA